jgi:Type IV secretion-system coupling protein DNA-binding domain
MKQKWGREEYAGEWPSSKAVWTIGAFFVALAAAATISAYRYARVWTPLERNYLTAYLATDASALRTDGWYALLMVETRKGPAHLAMDAEVTPAITPGGEKTFALTDAAVKAGDVKLEWQRGLYDNARLHAIMAHWIYNDHSPTDLARPALWGGLGVFLVGLLAAIPKDAARTRERKHGRRLKGPELVTARAFNRRMRADGIGFVQEQSVREKLTGKRRWVRVPRRVESSHFLIMGDSGTGKSALIRQILLQVEERGETAIVYDPALEYTPQFCDPRRGDRVLNPLDARMPYWTPGDELRQGAEALTLAASLFPDRHNENPFFVEGPRKIFAHLLTFHPTPEELVWWMSHPEEIDRRVRGTEYAAMIDPQSPPQRNGVLGSLNMVADALKLLPTEKQTTARWSTLEWASQRKGWLFFTSTPGTRKRLAPLISLWLDTLVLRLMNQGQVSARPVCFFLDELASLQRLPQLHTAITENRKSNNPVVLGFQGRSQLETRYGHEAEAMMSQPATKIFLRTSEPRAAKWISDAIGEVEIERIRESRSSGQYPQSRHTKSYNLERQVEPLVMASEISGLADRHGYLKSGNLVVRMHFPYMELGTRQPAYIAREAKIERPQLKEEFIVPASTATREQKIEPQPQEVAQTQQQAVQHAAAPANRQERFFE